MEALQRLTDGRTTLIIAHRLATMRFADRIIVLDEGRIVEEGTHAELLMRNGKYAYFCRLQFAPDLVHEHSVNGGPKESADHQRSTANAVALRFPATICDPD